jgi:hypothetical protein
MNLSSWLLQIASAISILAPNTAYPDVVYEYHYFEDQVQYEIYYDYVYQVNFTEFLLSDCTGDRSIAAKYFLGIRVTDAYQETLIEVDNLDDVFSGRSLSGRLWGELVRGVSRGNYSADPDDPVAFAQKAAHEYFDEYEGERDFLCDYIWWEEFEGLGTITSELLNDARIRYAGTQKLDTFLERTPPFQRNYQRILEKSPLIEK